MTGEAFKNQTANTSNEARVHIKLRELRWRANWHFSIREYLTQTSIGISTKHSISATSKMKRKRNDITIKEFVKLTKEVLPPLYPQFMGRGR